METSDEFNPFAAPATVDVVEPTTRGPDQTLLILRKKILCRGSSIELPAVCIFNGETHGLERRQRTLRVFTRWANFVFVLPGLLLQIIPILLKSQRPVSMIVQTAMVLSVVGLAAAVSAMIWLWGKDKLSVTWYVGDQCRRRAVLEKRIMMIIVALISIGYVACIPKMEMPFYLFAGLGPIILAGVVFRSNSERKPIPRSKQKDVFVLTGHSPAFHAAASHLSGNW